MFRNKARELITSAKKMESHLRRAAVTLSLCKFLHHQNRPSIGHRKVKTETTYRTIFSNMPTEPSVRNSCSKRTAALKLSVVVPPWWERHFWDSQKVQQLFVAILH